VANVADVDDVDDVDDEDDDVDDVDGTALVTLADVGAGAPVDDAAPADPDAVHAAASPAVSTVTSGTTDARTRRS
jgi:hypothetical protein